MAKIGLIILATGTYSQFLKPLVESVRKHFLTNHEVTPIILTDSKEPIDGCVRLETDPLGWPASTLKRYNVILKHQDRLQDYDYLYHLDADTLCVAPVTDEILGDLVGTLSPVGYEWPKERLPFERNASSAAYVPEGSGDQYYCGSFNGGKRDSFLAMARAVAAGVDRDEAAGVQARFHEESHLNKYYLENPPLSLSPEFCCPQGCSLRPKYSRRIILTLTKTAIDQAKGN